ncbi:MAG: CYTH domain-containing protein [Bacillota bacterium]|jgi:uncharacterized protein YjbK
MIEFEFKYSLNREEFTQLFNRLSNKYPKNTLLQINYYYDTDGFELEKQGINLRVRQKEADLKMELKTPILRERALRVKKEFSRSIKQLPLTINFNNDEWQGLIPGNGELHLIGILLTERTKFLPEPGIEIVLDKSYYLGLVDYELEVEFQKGLQTQALNVVKMLVGDGQKFPPSQHGKRKRFLKALKHLSQGTVR